MARLVLAGLAIAYGAASVAVALDYDPVAPTTYAATSSGTAATDVVAGLGLIMAGLLVSWQRPSGSIGAVAVLLGVVWFAPDWVGWEDGPALARSVAMVAAPLLLPLLVHLVVAVPGGRVAERPARLAVAVAYGVAAVVSIGLAFVRDPFLDQYCWSNCTDNVFLIHADPDLSRTLADVWLWFSVAGGVLLAGYACGRLLRASQPGRAAVWSVVLPAALAALAIAGYAIAVLRDPAEDPDGSAFHGIFVARALAFACLAAGLAWTVVRRRRTRDAIKRLAADLGETPEPGSLRAALAGSLGDARLEVAYRMPGSQAYVDADGRPVDVPTEDGRVTTPIVRSGEPVAVVIHDRAILGAQDLEREIGAAARLAVDNERLRAEVLAQIRDLRSSRARIVEAGDSARRRIERDLHDGAQQRLLTLSYELRLAQSAAEAAGDVDLAAAVAAPTEEVRAVLEELRDLAHGIYPAILTEAGLGAALATLADEAPIAVEIEEMDGRRYPSPVETAVYLAVDEAVTDAARRDATHTRVRVACDSGVLTTEVRDDGVTRSGGRLAAEDRIGALGGSVHVGASTLWLEVPCA